MADDAPAPAAPEAAPAPEPTAPAKAKTLDDELGEVLGRHGGLAYKANGSERKLSSVADLRRMLSSADGMRSALDEGMKAKQERDSWASQRERLKAIKPAERLEAIRDMGLDVTALREAYEEQILAEAQRYKQQETMTPRERELQRQLEENQAKVEAAEKQQREAQERQKQEALYAEAQKFYEHASSTVVEALKAAQVDPSIAPRVLPALLEDYQSLAMAGIEPDVAALTEVARTERRRLALDYFRDLSPADALEALRGMELEMPGEGGSPAKKVNYLRRMLEHEAQRRRQAAGAPTLPVVTSTPKPANGAPSLSDADKMAMFRTFGGDAAWKPREG